MTPPETANLQLESPGVHSNLSGPTAHSSLSDHEASELDRDLLIPEAGSLFYTAEKVLDFLAPSSATQEQLRTVVNQMRITGSRHSKLLTQNDRAFTVHLDVFGRTKSNPFIKVSTVLKALFLPNDIPTLSPGAYAIKEVLSVANLASFAKWLITSEKQSPDNWNEVRRLDNSFPAPFLDSFHQSDPTSDALAVGSSKLLDATFKFALELRTQVALIGLSIGQDEPHFDPDERLREVFFDESEGDDSPRVRGWDAAGLGVDNTALNGKYQKKVIQRFKDISEFFVEDRDVDFDGLNEKFPWSSFVLQGLDWVKRRNGELLVFLHQRGGVVDVIDTLEKLVKDSQAGSARKTTAAAAKPTSKAKKSRSTRFVIQQFFHD
jgi:hypothetical protein